MSLLTTQSASVTGLQATYGAVSASDTVSIQDDRVFLHVKNGGGSSDTVTIVTPGTVSGLAVADQAVVVANGTEKLIPIPASLYADPATGLVTIQHSFTTSVTCAIVRI